MSFREPVGSFQGIIVRPVKAFCGFTPFEERTAKIDFCSRKEGFRTDRLVRHKFEVKSGSRYNGSVLHTDNVRPANGLRLPISIFHIENNDPERNGVPVTTFRRVSGPVNLKHSFGSWHSVFIRIFIWLFADLLRGWFCAGEGQSSADSCRWIFRAPLFSPNITSTPRVVQLACTSGK